MSSGRGVSAFPVPVGLLGESLPGLRHFLHDFCDAARSWPPEPGGRIPAQIAGILLTFPCRNNRPLNGRVPGAWRSCRREPAFSARSVGLSAIRRGHGGCKAKTPPSGRGGVLRPSATPGEETRLRGPAIPIRARTLSSVRERFPLVPARGAPATLTSRAPRCGAQPQWIPACAGMSGVCSSDAVPRRARHTASRSFTAPSRSTETSWETPRSAMVTP
jgi:hypothetical protein